jgi:hypothetical protein
MDVSTSSLKRGSYTITFDSVLSGTITLSGEQLQIGNDTPATDLNIQLGARNVASSVSTLVNPMCILML